MKFKSWLLLTVAVFVCMFSIAAGYADNVPYTLNYQGYLTDGTGQPISGTKSITLSLYNTISGGAAFWTETIDPVNVIQGRFSIVLGAKTGNPLDLSKFTGTTYIGIQVNTDSEMAPRQQLTSVAYAFKVADAIPRGVITMWSGEIASIPTGWALCDGQPKTAPDGSTVTPPDLRDRFIVGAGNTYAKDDKAGNSTINLQHYHTTAYHTLTVTEMPSHNHGVTDPGHTHWLGKSDHTQDGDQVHRVNDTTDSTPYAYSRSALTGISIQNRGGDQGHNHGNTDSKLSTSQSIMPPYYALAFIMKL